MTQPLPTACVDTDALLIDVVFGEEGAAPAHVTDHLATCDRCQRALAELRETLAVTRTLPLDEPSPELDARILAELDAHLAAAAPATPRPALRLASSQPEVPTPATKPRADVGWRRYLAPLAAAAGVGVVAGGTWMMSRTGGVDPSARSEIAPRPVVLPEQIKIMRRPRLVIPVPAETAAPEAAAEAEGAQHTLGAFGGNAGSAGDIARPSPAGAKERDAARAELRQKNESAEKKTVAASRQMFADKDAQAGAVPVPKGDAEAQRGFDAPAKAKLRQDQGAAMAGNTTRSPPDAARQAPSAPAPMAAPAPAAVAAPPAEAPPARRMRAAEESASLDSVAGPRDEMMEDAAALKKEAPPPPWDTHLRDARAAAARRDYSRAAALYARVADPSARAPAEAVKEALSGRARALLALQRYDEAESVAGELASRFPDQSDMLSEVRRARAPAAAKAAAAPAAAAPANADDSKFTQ